MAIKTFKQFDDPIFKKELIDIDAADFDSVAFNAILQDMYDTHFQNPERVGVGLHAKQIGINKNLFLTYINALRAKQKNCAPIPVCFWVLEDLYVDPDDDSQEIGVEACFSVIGRYGENVPRYKSIIVTGWKITPTLDEKANIVSIQKEYNPHLKLTDYLARIFQHEWDHGKNLFYFSYFENGFEDTLELIPELDPRTPKSC